MDSSSPLHIKQLSPKSILSFSTKHSQNSFSTYFPRKKAHPFVINKSIKKAPISYAPSKNNRTQLRIFLFIMSILSFFFFFFIGKKAVYKLRRARGAQRLHEKETKTSHSPIPQPCQKPHQRIKVINIIQLSPRPQRKQKK